MGVEMIKKSNKSFILSGVCVVCFLMNSLICADADIEVGVSEKVVIVELGKPQGRASIGARETLFYHGGVIVLENGEVVSFDQNIMDKKPPSKNKAHFKFLEKEKKDIKKNNEPAVKVYKERGSNIDLKKVLVPGKTTIVDFYADWCGPCRKIGPRLEKMAKSDPAVFLRKIDIVNWNTPVVKQYKISSVPNIRVFDPNGRMVGQPSSNLNNIKDYVKTAKGK
jgi:thiol-disulfide isomerase/thioredoxin